MCFRILPFESVWRRTCRNIDRSGMVRSTVGQRMSLLYEMFACLEKFGMTLETSRCRWIRGSRALGLERKIFDIMVFHYIRIHQFPRIGHCTKRSWIADVVAICVIPGRST
jgi:hypothetical protein